MDGRSFVGFSVHLGDDARFACHTYEDHAPILAIDAGECSLTVAAGRRGVDEQDVVNARRLAQAAQIYLSELERLHARDVDAATAATA